MGLLAPMVVWFRAATEEKKKKAVIEKNLIDAVIVLPENLFYGTTIPACIIVFRQGKKNKDILFVDASKEFQKEKAKNKLKPENVQKIVAAYKSYARGDYAGAEIEK